MTASVVRGARASPTSLASRPAACKPAKRSFDGVRCSASTIASTSSTTDGSTSPDVVQNDAATVDRVDAVPDGQLDAELAQARHDVGQLELGGRLGPHGRARRDDVDVGARPGEHLGEPQRRVPAGLLEDRRPAVRTAAGSAPCRASAAPSPWTAALSIPGIPTRSGRRALAPVSSQVAPVATTSVSAGSASSSSTPSMRRSRAGRRVVRSSRRDLRSRGTSSLASAARRGRAGVPRDRARARAWSRRGRGRRPSPRPEARRDRRRSTTIGVGRSTRVRDPAPHRSSRPVTGLTTHATSLPRSARATQTFAPTQRVVSDTRPSRALRTRCGSARCARRHRDRRRRLRRRRPARPCAVDDASGDEDRRAVADDALREAAAAKAWFSGTLIEAIVMCPECDAPIDRSKKSKIAVSREYCELCQRLVDRDARRRRCIRRNVSARPTG